MLLSLLSYGLSLNQLMSSGFLLSPSLYLGMKGNDRGERPPPRSAKRGGVPNVRDGLERESRGGPLQIGGSAGTTDPKGIGRPNLKEGS